MIVLPKNIDIIGSCSLLTALLFTPVVSAQEPGSSTSLVSLLGDGGLLMIPIGICSLVLVMFSLERMMNLRIGRIIPKPFVRRVLEQLKSGELDKRSAYRLCKENKSLVAEVFSVALRKWGKPAQEVEPVQPVDPVEPIQSLESVERVE